MQYRTYGKTQEKVSVLGFGCMRLPIIDNDPTKIDEAKAIAMLRHAIDSGVNYVDTAYPYHGSGFAQGGQSEPFVGKALRDGYREKVKLATKLPSWLIKTRADMERYLDEQLQRLETETIDFYLVHSLNKTFWPNLQAAGITEFLDQALSEGKIKHAGFSFHDEIGLFKEIVDAYDWSFCQIQYNYLDEAYQAGYEGLRYAAAKGLGIAIMEPLRGGNLIRLPQAAKEVLNGVAPERSAAEWALRWLWNQPEVSLVLSGMTTMEQLEENLRSAEKGDAFSLTQEELAATAKVKEIFQSLMRVNCTSCGYCMPCPAGINIPMCFSTYNNHWLFDAPPSAKAQYMNWSKLAAPASACIKCGKCEGHCPQSIAIRAELEKVTELFE